DTHPSLDTSLNHEEEDLEIDEPQSDIFPIRRSTRTRHAPDRMCLYIDAEEHELGDLGEPANYKAALLDPESEKWLNAMNVEMQSMKDNEVWVLVELPPIGKIVGKKILKRHCMENSKRGSIPMQEKLKLSKSQGAATPVEMKRMQNVPYASAVGSIMYAVRCTRPDVAFAQNITSRFQQNPGDIHWTTVKNILKYLKNTKDMFLVYGGDLKRELRVSCYTDSGYLTDADDLKSQTGYVFVLNGGAVDWESAKQSIFATSYVEAKYIAAFAASKEAAWVRKFIAGLSVVPTIEEPISMYCDNTGAIRKVLDTSVPKFTIFERLLSLVM
nr:retrotransposon protein, putative, Ty1-copia subclass [Tanacetum cinerariifolium]